MTNREAIQILKTLESASAARRSLIEHEAIVMAISSLKREAKIIEYFRTEGR